MCRSMVHIQSPTAEIRRGKEIERKKKKKKPQAKNIKNSVVVSKAFCNSTADTPYVCLNEIMVLVQSIFHNIWIEVRK